MSVSPLVCLFLMLVFTAAALTPEEAEARLRMARQIARERNDRELVQRVEKLAREFKAGLPAEAEEQLRETEKTVGIDPGGWSMTGQRLFHPTAAMEAALKAEGPKLAAAMALGDAKAVLRSRGRWKAFSVIKPVCRMVGAWARSLPN